jgi:hypothetical protein
MVLKIQIRVILVHLNQEEILQVQVILQEAFKSDLQNLDFYIKVRPTHTFIIYANSKSIS